MSSTQRLAWALPIAAAAFFGCAHNKTMTTGKTRSVTTTTTVTAYAPQQGPVGGGPTDVSTDGPQRLDPARADRMVEARKESFRNDCYSPDRGAVSFVIDASIAPDGRVEKAEVASSNGDRDVAECVRNRFQKMTFPQTAEGGTHSFTFLFGH